MTIEELFEQIKLKNSFLCVGLDSDIKKIPNHLHDEEDPIYSFNKAIVDATAPYCVAFKLNVAFYECLGVQGWYALEKTIAYIQQCYPKHFIIADGKRGDIGNTSEMYAQYFFDKIKVNATTVSPYMGEDSVKPFLSYAGKWVILLALTSNKGSHDFQLIEDKEGNQLFEHVLHRSQEWASVDQIMYVVGATQENLIEAVRKIVPNHFLLIPGIGTQGGSLEEVCKYGMNSQCGLLVNSSRSIIYAGDGQHFATDSAREAKRIQLEMSLMLTQYLK